ncbi:hypothetical protein ACFLXU_00160 [Chloroflexota bacterium]
MAIAYIGGIVGIVDSRQTGQNRLAIINKIPPVTVHFQAIPTMANKGRLIINAVGSEYRKLVTLVKGASPTAMENSAITTIPARPTINPAWCNFF